jgi:streptomycin 6-kinase
LAFTLSILSDDSTSSDSCARTGLNKDLQASTEAKDKRKDGFLLDIIVGQGTTVLKLLAREDKVLLFERKSRVYS